MLLYVLYTLSLDLHRESAPCSRGQRSKQAFQVFSMWNVGFSKSIPFDLVPQTPNETTHLSLLFSVLLLSLSLLASIHPSIPPSDPSWGSCSLGVFICVQCSGIHRNIPDIGMKVKSLSLSRWEDQEVKVSCLPKWPKSQYFFKSNWLWVHCYF